MTVVVAIDGVEGSEQTMTEAHKLAARFETELHVVFVYEHSEHTHLANRYMDIAEPIDEDRVSALVEQVIADAAEGITDEYEAVGRVGDPANEILSYANEIDADYIVVGGRSRSAVGKALFGSVTQGVLLDAECPVLAVMTEREEDGD